MVASTVGSVKEQQCCAHCGQAAPRALAEWWMGFGETYQGDEQVIRTERQPTYADYLAKTHPCFRVTEESWERQMQSPFKRWKVWTWDGVSYRKLRFGAFCSIRCGLAYAQAAHDRA